MDELLFSDEDRELVERSLEYLRDIPVSSAYNYFNEENGLYCIYVDDEEFDDAKEHLLRFLKGELHEVEDELSEEDISQTKKDLEASDAAAAEYNDIDEKYNDTKSSAHILIGFGLAGIIALALEFFDIYTIPVASNIKPLFYITMLVMFTAFFVGGLLSLRSAARIKEKSNFIKELKSQVCYFVSHDISKASIDEQLDTSDTLTGEDLYFARCNLIRKAMSAGFADTDKAYLDAMVDDAYQRLYEEDEQK